MFFTSKLVDGSLGSDGSFLNDFVNVLHGFFGAPWNQEESMESMGSMGSMDSMEPRESMRSMKSWY